MKYFTPAVLLSSLLAFSVVAQPLVPLAGSIKDENNKAIQGVKVSINGQVTTTGDKGDFELKLIKSDIYRVDVSANSYYESVHTFSHYELQQANSSFTLPTINLVHKKTGRVLFIFAGDTMMGRRFSLPHAGEPVLIRGSHKAEDSKSLLKVMAPYFAPGDFISVNLETQIMEKAPELKAEKSVTFFSAPETLTALSSVGVDYVSLGNNHTYDYLNQGLAETLHYLNNSQLAYSGAGMGEQQALQAYRTRIAKQPYSFLSFVGWQGSSLSSQAAGNKAGPALGTYTNIVNTIKREKLAGYYPVVQLHGGLEYAEEPTGTMEMRLKAAIDQGASLAIGHHPHVLQGVEIYKNRFIAYSLGNFIFDQYFYSSQATALMYVWMDAGLFSRAEIVPVYIKGYIPTPATGMMRQHVLKRIAALSARRGVDMAVSGAHGIVSLNSKRRDEIRKEAITINTVAEKETILSVQKQAWNRSLLGLESDHNVQYRLGMCLLSRGDFESHYTFSALDRSWFFSNDLSGIDNTRVFQGKYAMQLLFAPGEKRVSGGMRKFLRVFTPATPSTFFATAYTETDALLKIYIQGRKRRMSLTEALERGPKQLIGTVHLRGNNWQSFNIDFHSERVRFRSYRFIIEAVPAHPERSNKVSIDNIALIEWQTPPTDAGQLTNIEKINRVTHLGIKNNNTGNVKATLVYH